MVKLKKSFLDACRMCLKDMPKDENLYFPHSLPICVIDAVFSIGIRYEMAQKAWINYKDYYKLSFLSMEDVEKGIKDDCEHTINDFVDNVNSFDDIESFRSSVKISRHRTSSRNGILKIEAVYEIARILQKHSINTVEDFRDYPDHNTLDKEICSVRGQRSGIMLKYLYMLAGDKNKCKLDRVLRAFVAKYYPNLSDDEIIELLNNTVSELKEERSDLTLRLLDCAIWKETRKK